MGHVPSYGTSFPVLCGQVTLVGSDLHNASCTAFLNTGRPCHAALKDHQWLPTPWRRLQGRCIPSHFLGLSPAPTAHESCHPSPGVPHCHTSVLSSHALAVSSLSINTLLRPRRGWEGTVLFQEERPEAGTRLAVWGLGLRQGKKQQMSSAPLSDTWALKNGRKRFWALLISSGRRPSGLAKGWQEWLWGLLNLPPWPFFYLPNASFLCLLREGTRDNEAAGGPMTQAEEAGLASRVLRIPHLGQDRLFLRNRNPIKITGVSRGTTWDLGTREPQACGGRLSDTKVVAPPSATTSLSPSAPFSCFFLYFYVFFFFFFFLQYLFV